MIFKNLIVSKFCAVFLLFPSISACQEKTTKPQTKADIASKTDPFQPTIDRLIKGEKIPLEQLVAQLKNRTWKEIQPLMLISIKKRSQQKNWTTDEQRKALGGYSRVKFLFAKRLRKQTLEELKNAIQKALKEENAVKSK